MKETFNPIKIMSLVDLLSQIKRRVGALIPPDWTLAVDCDAPPGTSRAEGRMTVTPSSGPSTTFVVEAHLSPPPLAIATAAALRMKATTIEAGVVGSNWRRVVAAPFLSPAVRRQLIADDVGYVDLTGNVRLADANSGLLIVTEGADKLNYDPHPKLASLRGRAAIQVSRALIDLVLQMPITTADLARLAGVSPSQTWRVVELLAGEGIVQRDSRGRLSQYNWSAVLERWAMDYSFESRARPAGFMSLRGPRRIVDDLRAVTDERWAITGQFAAEHYSPLAPPRTLQLFAENPGAIIDRVDLVPAQGAPDVLIAAPPAPAALDRLVNAEGVSWCAPSQVFADMWTGRGRSRQQAETLLVWMTREEGRWRREP